MTNPINFSVNIDPAGFVRCWAFSGYLWRVFDVKNDVTQRVESFNAEYLIDGSGYDFGFYAITPCDHEPKYPENYEIKKIIVDRGWCVREDSGWTVTCISAENDGKAYLIGTD